jgi:hypothetical protein
MSNKTSNLYASRAFAEHPIALWSLDEDFTFLSLISNSYKDLENWSKVNASVDTLADLSGFESVPLSSDFVTNVNLMSPSAGYTLSLTSASISNSLNLDSSKGTVSINSYVFHENSSIISVSIGFNIDGTERLTKYFNLEKNKWSMVSHTAEVSNSTSITPVIKMEFSSYSSDPVTINGLSVGQWSESYRSVSTGIVKQSFPPELKEALDLTDSFYVVPIDVYGINDEDNGYAVISENRMLIKDTGIPMVFGSNNNTSIQYEENVFYELIDGGTFDSPAVSASIDGGTSSFSGATSEDAGFYFMREENTPSVIIPGKGMLNQLGRHKATTLEFWCRVNNESNKPVKIFGSLFSDDGIYVSNSFISIKFGNNKKSHFIGKWYRPILMHLVQTPSKVKLLINGETVISIDIDDSDFDLISSSDDYVGFYGHINVFPFDIDCVSIYPYEILDQTAKKKFVFGQGVQKQESIIENINGDLFYIDFSFSNYTATTSYPERNPWQGGFHTNLDVSGTKISSIQYSLPELIFKNVVENSATTVNAGSEIWNNFSLDNFNIQDEEYAFINMNPNNLYSNIYASLFFSKLNQLSNSTKSVFGVFRAPQSIPSTRETIFQISKNNSTNIFKVCLSSSGLEYIYNSTVIKTIPISAGEAFTAGIDLDLASVEYTTVLSSFFKNKDTLNLSLGGYENNNFTGRIYNLTFNDKFFTNKDCLDFFDDNGIALKSVGNKFSYVGAYTLVPKKIGSSVVLDVASSGYWEDSLPLSYFGKPVRSNTRNRVLYYDLDNIQINFDAPSPIISSVDSSYSYDPKDVKAYVTLQSKSSVGITPYSSYTNINTSGKSRVLNFDDFTNNDIAYTKFEIVDGTIIFPPKQYVDFRDYFITIHFEIKSESLGSNIEIKSLRMSSMAIDESSFYPINTPNGNKIYPFTRSEDNYVYRKMNPILISQESTPYLYLSQDSGINILPSDSNLTRGISIPINSDKKPSYSVSGLQMFAFYNESKTFSSVKQFAKISGENKKYQITLEPESDKKRAKLVVYDLNTGAKLEGLKYYLNGKNVQDVYIEPLQWNFISISFENNLIDIPLTIGQLEIYPGFIFDNISLFKKSSEITGAETISDDWYKPYQDVNNLGIPVGSPNTWDMYDDETIWRNVLNTQNITTSTIDGENIFNSYTGVAIVSGSDDKTLVVDFDSVSILNGTDWDTFEYKPI